MGGDYSSRNGFGSPVHPHGLDALLPELEGKRIDSTTASRISGDNFLDKGTREFQCGSLTFCHAFALSSLVRVEDVWFVRGRCFFFYRRFGICR